MIGGGGGAPLQPCIVVLGDHSAYLVLSSSRNGGDRPWPIPENGWLRSLSASTLPNKSRPKLFTP